MNGQAAENGSTSRGPSGWSRDRDGGGGGGWSRDRDGGGGGGWSRDRDGGGGGWGRDRDGGAGWRGGRGDRHNQDADFVAQMGR